MMAKMKASWMSSRISQRMRRRRNQCSSAIVRPCRGAEHCFPAREAGGTGIPGCPGLRANAHWRMVAAARRHELIC